MKYVMSIPKWTRVPLVYGLMPWGERSQTQHSCSFIHREWSEGRQLTFTQRRGPSLKHHNEYHLHFRESSHLKIIRKNRTQILFSKTNKKQPQTSMDSPLGVLEEGLRLPANGGAEKGSPHIIANKAFFKKQNYFFFTTEIIYWCVLLLLL